MHAQVSPTSHFIHLLSNFTWGPQSGSGHIGASNSGFYKDPGRSFFALVSNMSFYMIFILKKLILNEKSAFKDFVMHQQCVLVRNKKMTMTFMFESEGLHKEGNWKTHLQYRSASSFRRSRAQRDGFIFNEWVRLAAQEISVS